jgi:hypothetical protein
MRAFLPFYDARGLEPPLAQVHRWEERIVKEVETAIRQVRSSRNQSTKMRRNAATEQVLRLQLDLIEDMECDRVPERELPQKRALVERELLKLVPENYRLTIMPAFFNYHDAERIRTVICDQAQEFLLMQKPALSTLQSTVKKKVMFAVGVKIYAFHSGVTSVRLAIARMTPLQGTASLAKHSD